MPALKFQFAGLVFQVFLPHSIEWKESFLPFGADREEADCVANFVEKESIACPDGVVVAGNDALEVLAVPDGTWVRRYLATRDKERCISLGRTMPDGSVLVEFLPEAREYLTNTENVFFHIAMEEQLLRHGRWIVHASCVKTPFGALLFAGASGVGKTTQAELWERYRGSKVLNGDRTILYQDNGVWYASGSPYAGSSKRYVNESAPVCGVVLLEQGRENRLCNLSPGQAFRSLYPHLTVNDWNPWYVETIVDQLEQLTRVRPTFHFSCTADETAVDVLWGKLTMEVNHGK